MSRKAISDDDEPHLTGMERTVLALRATGATVKDIAQQLDRSRNTVETHLKSLYRKLAVSNVAALIAKARQLGFLD
jgi:DNA-binding CsgD family transcriptional regulator